MASARELQLAELASRVPAMRPLGYERTTFELSLPVASSSAHPVVLRLMLPSGFPVDPPALIVKPAVAHSWVDIRTGRVAYDGLARWSLARGSSLADIVFEIAQEVGASVLAGPAAEHPVVVPRPAPPLATEAELTAALARMSTAELQAAITEDGTGGAFESLASRLAPLVAGPSGAAAATDATRAAVVEAATANLALASEADALRAQIAIIRASDYDPARSKLQRLADRQAAALKRVEPMALLDGLVASARDSDAAAEALHQRLLARDPTLPADAFLAAYRAQRAASHRRALVRAAALAGGLHPQAQATP